MQKILFIAFEERSTIWNLKKYVQVDFKGVKPVVGQITVI